VCLNIAHSFFAGTNITTTANNNTAKIKTRHLSGGLDHQTNLVGWTTSLPVHPKATQTKTAHKLFCCAP